MRLKRDFFERETLKVAREMLGKFLTVNERTGKITEVEAYMGHQDRASHTFSGKITKRNKLVYKGAGFVYIYLVYGMYWQFNITTNVLKKPECVLIRGVLPVEGFDKNLSEKERIKLANGPGKLCRWLGLNKSFYGEDITKSGKIKLENRGEGIKRKDIVATSRIGIDYAGEDKDKPWRFCLK